jgi:hypothetical protein
MKRIRIIIPYGYRHTVSEDPSDKQDIWVLDYEHENRKQGQLGFISQKFPHPVFLKTFRPPIENNDRTGQKAQLQGWQMSGMACASQPIYNGEILQVLQYGSCQD